MIHHGYPEPKTPSRVVILGASGFVAKNLKNFLSELSIPVICVSSTHVDLRKPEAAVALKEIVRQDDALVFASAVTPDKGRDALSQAQNFRMGENVADFFEKSSCSHVVYISSDAVYADGDSLVRENTLCGPSSFYGVAHLAREKMLAEVLNKRGIPFLILRPCALYGSGDTHNSYGPNRFIRSAIEQKKILLFGGGEEKRDHLFIKDLCRLLGLCLSYRSQGILNAASGKSVSFYDLASLISRCLVQPIAIETSVRQSVVTHRHFDTTAVMKAFAFFQYTPLKDAVDEILASMGT